MSKIRLKSRFFCMEIKFVKEKYGSRSLSVVLDIVF